MTHNEKILEDISRELRIPTPPSVALRVLERASQPDCNLEDLHHIIAMDPALSAKILKTVNSALYGLPRVVTTIPRALSIIGLNSARSLTLSLSLPEMHRGVTPRDDFMREYWKHSVIGAITMRELSKRIRRREPEEDSTAGLLRDLGLVVLRQSFPERYQRIVDRPEIERAANLCDWERHYCGVDHAEISAMILKQWRFPEDFVEAIRVHHDAGQGRFANPFFAERAYMLQFASLIAQIQLTPDHTPTFRQIVEMAKARFGMDEIDLLGFLGPLDEKIHVFARVLDVDIGPTHEFANVMARASLELVNLTVAANLDHQRMTEQKRRAESEARRWREQAVFDPLTKSFNRLFLESQLNDLFARSYEPNTGIGLLFIDLDGFKILNDKHGHQFGDRVLVEVSYALRKLVRQGDVVARFGGDEFCILVENTNEQGLRALANRVWDHIQKLVIRQGEREGQVGASIGVVLCNPSFSGQTPDTLLAKADQAMYEAKRNGKNRVTYFSAEEAACSAK